MGILSGLLGHAAEVDTEKVEAQIKDLLAEGEEIVQAYKLVRDITVLTNKRLVLIDKQGLTGKRIEYLSVPYRSIVTYTITSTGHFDIDAELRLQLTSRTEPLVMEFKKTKDVHKLVRLITTYAC